MKVIRPLGTNLAASSVPENDFAAWVPGTTYAAGARVIVAAIHRVFESAVAGNQGHDPSTAGSTFWIDVGPTNRWAMFDPASGPATSSAASIVVTLSLDDSADTIGLVDLQAASVRVQITSAGTTILDVTRGAPAACEAFLDLPLAATRVATITITPLNGAAIVGKLITGAAITLGTLGDGPTVGITDYSRRDTDAFGVTTVVKRGWSRRIEVKCLVDDAAVNGIQRQLASIRAVPALWIGEGGYPSLISYGFYKDFSQVVSLQGISTCSLSIEGLPAAETTVPAVDPAFGGPSDFQVARPIEITDAVLVSSSVPENDYPAYRSGTAYVAGARVVLPATHRAYESLTNGNAGHDPATSAANWLDIGPTNRWAMFDQALGTATAATGSIALQLKPNAANDTLALLDIVGASVRVQAPGYDQTRLIDAANTTALFLDLMLFAGDLVSVTVSGADSGAPVAVGTLLLGAREGLGRLADEPVISNLDFSVKQTDDFGQTTLTERAWAKKMEGRSQIATSAADTLARRLATLRATPSLWIGAADFDALIVYGFYRDFTITLGEHFSTCAMTIEGLAKGPEPKPASAVALTAYLTNEDHTVPADAAGNVTSYAGASGTFIIRDGADEVQDSFNLFTEANPQGLAVIYDGATYAVTGGLDAGEDAATLTIKAVGFGSYSGITATKQFGLTKSKAGGAGAAGAAAKLLSIRSNRQTISYDGAGTPTPTDQTITFGVNKQNTAATVYWSITDAAGTPVSLTYLSASTGDSIYITENNFRLARGGTNGVIVTGALTDGATLSDSISVVAVSAGANGAQGAPGARGADGQTLYTWIAYADSADGTVNFTNGAPGNRGYQGIAVNKTSSTESTNAADYVWGPYRGPAGFGLVAQAKVVVGPDYVARAAASSEWDGSAYSSEAFIGGAFVSFTAGADIGATMVGLNTDPTTSTGYDTIDFALYTEQSINRVLQVFESGVFTTVGNWSPGDKLTISYDNKTVRYFQNGNLLRSVGASPGLKLYFDCSMSWQNTRISDIKFGPAGAAGLDGSPGQKGDKGDKGDQGNPGSAGSNGAPAVYLKVTAKAASVQAYSNGVVKSFANANGLLTVMSGPGDVTAGAFLSASATGCSGTINTAYGNPVAGQPKGFYQVTDMSADTATLTLSANYNGQVMTEVFSVSKLLGGYEIVSSLPNSNLFEGRVVYLMADKKLYRFDGNGWNRSADGADLAPNSVTTNALAAGAVTATQINVTYLSAITQTVGFLTSRVGGQGAGFELDNNGYRLFATNNVLAIEITV